MSSLLSKSDYGLLDTKIEIISHRVSLIVSCLGEVLPEWAVTQLISLNNELAEEWNAVVEEQRSRKS